MTSPVIPIGTKLALKSVFQGLEKLTQWNTQSKTLLYSSRKSKGST